MVGNRKALADILGVDVRSIKNFVDDDMPKLARGKYDIGACVKWYVEHEREKARAGKGLNDLDLARQRKTIAEAREAEMRVAQMESSLVPMELLTEMGERVADRLLPVLQNIPANYGLRLEELGIRPEQAEAVLESISLDLTTTLHNAIGGEHAADVDVPNETETNDGSADAVA